jgi:atypical dual specificity phosphatase
MSAMQRLVKRVQLILSALGLRVDRGDWLMSDRLLGCAYPKSDAALAALQDQGIGLLINLHERAHADTRLRAHGLSSEHLPIRDFSAPSSEQLHCAIAAIDEAVGQGQRVAVHCGGGLGRTGTVLACYLVHQGTPPDDAIERVRALRPGSIETRAQVAAIRTFARTDAAMTTSTD